MLGQIVLSKVEVSGLPRQVFKIEITHFIHWYNFVFKGLSQHAFTMVKLKFLTFSISKHSTSIFFLGVPPLNVKINCTFESKSKWTFSSSLQNRDYPFHVLIQFCFKRFVRAFIMIKVKFLAFSILKTHFIYFNTLFYKISDINIISRSVSIQC